MTSAHGNKSGRRYFYYVSTALAAGKRAGSLARVSAPTLEHLVTEAVAPRLTALRHDAANADDALSAVERVSVGAERLRIELKPDAMTAAGPDEAIVLDIPHALKRRKDRRRLLNSGSPNAPRVDRALVRALVMARRWSDMLAAGEATSIQALAQREGQCPIYTGQLIPLAFLAPDLAAAILDGRQPTGLTLSGLIAKPLPLRWAKQRALFARYH